MFPTLTPDIHATLSRYLEIQAEERRLKEEKQELQQKLAQHLIEYPGKYWQVEVGAQVVKVTRSESTRIEYDEETLNRRLGERYLEILSPDPKKMKSQTALIESYLRPVLPQIGSPDREKIRRGIEEGRFSIEDFSGTFQKVVKTYIAVSMVSPSNGGFAPGDDPTGPPY